MGSSQEVGDSSTTALAQGNDVAWEAPYAINQRQAHVNSAVRTMTTFEALHRVYFYDAWRVQPVLDAPESDLVLPPKSGPFRAWLLLASAKPDT